MLLDGILAPICTPFANDGEIHHQALRDNLAKYNRTALLGYVVGGSTGEAALLDPDEKLALFETARAAAADKILIAGTAAESVRETLRVIAPAASIDYRAALVITPHYYRAQMLRPESQLAFFRAWPTHPSSPSYLQFSADDGRRPGC